MEGESQSGLSGGTGYDQIWHPDTISMNVAAFFSSTLGLFNSSGKCLAL